MKYLTIAAKSSVSGVVDVVGTAELVEVIVGIAAAEMVIAAARTVIRIEVRMIMLWWISLTVALCFWKCGAIALRQYLTVVYDSAEQ